ncbi:MAG TPA: hypothetical protein VD969_09845 [Symbiobacteriaceae bacterium]|nr:hypothetical protein [Symbiobacteriaceae bacterium]
MQNRQWGGLLLLTGLRFDTTNGVWEAEFQTDGRIPGRPRSHPAERLSDDPVAQRKLQHSWVSVATHLLDGDLVLWQLLYGQGRRVEVWGLTSSPGVVVAHRIAMPDPPAESLLASPLERGLPLYPGAWFPDGQSSMR